MSAHWSRLWTGLTLVSVTGGIGSLWLAPGAWADADLAALGIQQVQAGQLQLWMTWQGENPPSPQIHRVSDHRLVVAFQQVHPIDPTQYSFPSELDRLGIQSVHWSQQGTTGQIEIHTQFPLGVSLGTPLRQGSASTQQITIRLEPDSRGISSQPSSLPPQEPDATAIANERARLEALLQDLRHPQASALPVDRSAAQDSVPPETTPSISVPPVPPQPPAQQDSQPIAPPLLVLEPITESSPDTRSTIPSPQPDRSSPEIPRPDPQQQAEIPASSPLSISTSKLADLSIPFSTARRGPLIAQSPATANDGATGFMSYMDSRTSAFTSELSKLEQHLRQIRWTVLQKHQPSPHSPTPEEEIVILTPSLSYHQKPSPPDLVELYGSEPPPSEDLIDLYGSDPDPDPPSSVGPDPFPNRAIPLAQIPTEQDPIDPIPPPDPDQPPAPTVVNIPTSHRVGALATDRGTPQISSANSIYTQLRSLNGALGGILFSRTDRQGETNINQITPDNLVPILFRYGDEGIGVDAATIASTVISTTTLFDSTIFDVDTNFMECS